MYDYKKRVRLPGKSKWDGVVHVKGPLLFPNCTKKRSFKLGSRPRRKVKIMTRALAQVNLLVGEPFQEEDEDKICEQPRFNV